VIELEVTSKRKVEILDNSVYVYSVDVIAYNDCYLYGMIMPGRNDSENDGEECRYSFQGQEKDDEVKGKGNSINYKYRMHDPRIGRFFAVDPLASKYPHNSPYAFSENIVIHGVELEGLELGWVITQAVEVAEGIAETLPTAESIQALSDDIDNWLMGTTYEESHYRKDYRPDWGGIHYLNGGSEGSQGAAIETNNAIFDNTPWVGTSGVGKGKHYKRSYIPIKDAEKINSLKKALFTAPTGNNSNGQSVSNDLPITGAPSTIDVRKEQIEIFNGGTNYTLPSYEWRIVSTDIIGFSGTEYRIQAVE